GVSGSQHDGTIAPGIQSVDLAVVQPGDLAALLGGFVHVKELPLHAGADENMAILPQDAEEQGLLPKQLANRAVRGDAIERVLADDRRWTRGSRVALLKRINRSRRRGRTDRRSVGGRFGAAARRRRAWRFRRRGRQQRAVACRR